MSGEENDYPLTVPTSFSNSAMYAAARRELKYRRRVYPHLVGQGKMTRLEAEYEIAVMEAIAEHFHCISEPKLL